MISLHVSGLRAVKPVKTLLLLSPCYLILLSFYLLGQNYLVAIKTSHACPVPVAAPTPTMPTLSDGHADSVLAKVRKDVDRMCASEIHRLS